MVGADDDPQPRRLLDGRGRRRRVHLRQRPIPRIARRRCGSTRPSTAWPRPASGNGYWLVAWDGGIFTLRRRALPRIHRRDAPQPPGRRHGADAERQGLLARRIRRRHLHVRRRAFRGSTGALAARVAGRRHGADAERQGLLARRIRRRRVHLRRRALLRIARRHARCRRRSSASCPTKTGKGYWLELADASVAARGDARHFGNG